MDLVLTCEVVTSVLSWETTVREGVEINGVTYICDEITYTTNCVISLWAEVQAQIAGVGLSVIASITS